MEMKEEKMGGYVEEKICVGKTEDFFWDDIHFIKELREIGL